LIDICLLLKIVIRLTSLRSIDALIVGKTGPKPCQDLPAQLLQRPRKNRFQTSILAASWQSIAEVLEIENGDTQ